MIFFFKQKTAYEISLYGVQTCALPIYMLSFVFTEKVTLNTNLPASMLYFAHHMGGLQDLLIKLVGKMDPGQLYDALLHGVGDFAAIYPRNKDRQTLEIGRASCRERV